MPAKRLARGIAALAFALCSVEVVADTPDQIGGHLKPYVGKWRVQVLVADRTNRDEQVKFVGVAEIAMIGNRWLVRRIHANAGMNTFDSEDVLGYDAGLSSWVGVWADSVHPALVRARGSRAADGTLTFHALNPASHVETSWSDRWLESDAFTTRWDSGGASGSGIASIAIRHDRVP